MKTSLLSTIALLFGLASGQQDFEAANQQQETDFTPDGYPSDAYLQQLESDIEEYEQVYVDVLSLTSEASNTLDPLDKLPPDATFSLKWACFNRAWERANIRRNLMRDAEYNEKTYQNHMKDFRKKMQGWIEGWVLDRIDWMINDITWMTANTRADIMNDAKKDEANFNNNADIIRGSGAFTPETSEDIIQMAIYGAWHAANDAKGFKEDAKRDMDRFNLLAGTIQAEVTIRSMKFKMDMAKMGASRPLAVGSQILENNSDKDQSMTFKYSKQMGHTTSTSTEINFQHTVTSSFEVGFLDFASASLEVQYSFGVGQTFEQSMETEVTKEYEFPVVVPPHQTYEAKATIQETDMDIPYELVLRFGNHDVRQLGMWKGVSSSRAHYVVQRVDK